MNKIINVNNNVNGESDLETKWFWIDYNENMRIRLKKTLLTKLLLLSATSMNLSYWKPVSKPVSEPCQDDTVMLSLH